MNKASLYCAASFLIIGDYPQWSERVLQNTANSSCIYGIEQALAKFKRALAKNLNELQMGIDS